MAYDVFISYRRRGGYETAKHLYDLLIRDGYNVSFDLDTLRNGDFDTQLLTRIGECTDFILILNKGAFDRSIDPTFDRSKDWMRIEIAEALKKGKNIIPIMLPGFDNYPDNLPEDIAEVSRKNGPKHSMEYFDEFYRKLKENFMQINPVTQQLPPPLSPKTEIKNSYDNPVSELKTEANFNDSEKSSILGCLGWCVGIIIVVFLFCWATDFWDYITKDSEKESSFNVEEKVSEYKEKELDEFNRKLLKEWKFILTKNNKGMILTMMGEIILHQDFDEFLQYSFNDYVKGYIEPTNYYLEWRILPIFDDGFTFEFHTPINISNNTTEAFMEMYDLIEGSKYNENEWNPVKDLNNAGFIDIIDINVSKDGKSGYVDYTTTKETIQKEITRIELVKKSGKWKINNFSKDDILFTDEIRKYFKK